jgi:hypothetical protein
MSRVRGPRSWAVGGEWIVVKLKRIEYYGWEAGIGRRGDIHKCKAIIHQWAPLNKEKICTDCCQSVAITAIALVLFLRIFNRRVDNNQMLTIYSQLWFRGILMLFLYLFYIK